MNDRERIQSLDKIAESLRNGHASELPERISEALKQGFTGEEILQDGLLRGINELGEQFKNNEVFVPEVLIAARAMNRGLDLLAPSLQHRQSGYQGTVVLGTVQGDIHDIGKKIVGMMLEGAGFEVDDLGIDVPVERFLGALDETQADIVGMSAMLTTTMPVMGEVTAALKADPKYAHVKAMIGGAPVTESYGEQIGARFSYDAASAVDLAKELMPAK